MAGLTTYISSALSLLLIFVLKKILSNRSNPNYPPGPPGQLFIGNLRQIPDKKPWLAYTEWTKKYGDIVHLEVMGDHIVVLNSSRAANDLLEKRSRIYSGRPYEDVALTTGWDINLSLQDYSDRWRKNRRLYQQTFRPDAVIHLLPAVQQCVGIFLENLLGSPEKFMHHAAALSGGLPLKIMYGLRVATGEDPLIHIAESATSTMDTVFSQRFIALLKCFPFIMSAPRWIPVLGPVRKYVEATRKHLQDLREVPLQHAQRNVESGLENDGIALRLLRRVNMDHVNSGEEINRIKDMAAITYAAGADTTLSSVNTFFLAMARDSNFQKLAQQEIDRVVGRDRLPTLDDRASLPHVEAIYREVMRWHPVVPLGGPHMVSEADNYRGYYIPQGTIVFANIWAITHDPEVFSDPYDFKPERFLDSKGHINDVVAYGYGRRICVGRHLADAALWLSFASVLACFKIEKEKDEQGHEIDIPEAYSDGPAFFSHPLPFRCSITRRHEGVKSLVT